MYNYKYIYGGGENRKMARVKSKHVQHRYLLVRKLQIILFSLLCFSMCYTMCIHYFHRIKTGLFVSLR